MTSFAGCAWIRPATDKESVAGTLLSYCASMSIADSTECGTVLVNIRNIYPSIKVIFAGRKHFTELSNPITTRSHLCIVMSTSLAAIYVNGSFLVSSTVHNRDPVPGNGLLILGQMQYGPISRTSPGKQIFADEGFHGEIEDFTLWNRALSASEILAMYKSGGCYCPSDAVVTFKHDNSIVSDRRITYNWNDACDQNE